MPELPDVEVYVACLRRLTVGQKCERIRIGNPFVLRSVSPPLDSVAGQTVMAVDRMGKRVVFTLTNDLFIVIHLMIAGRLRWRDAGSRIPKKLGLAAFDFPTGTVLLTEAGSTKRAAVHAVRGQTSLEEHDPGGLEVMETGFTEFSETLVKENHTLKRALTDPRLFSGIGNTYSDEILHAAKLSPLALTRKLRHEEAKRLYAATRTTLANWLERLRDEVGEGFPENVTSVRPGMAVHGRYREPCPQCGTPIQRIVYASNEANYCPRCQTGGKVLKDRAMSRLLKDDWPRSIETWEERRSADAGHLKDRGLRAQLPTRTGS